MKNLNLILDDFQLESPRTLAVAITSALSKIRNEFSDEVEDGLHFKYKNLYSSLSGSFKAMKRIEDSYGEDEISSYSLISTMYPNVFELFSVVEKIIGSSININFTYFKSFENDSQNELLVPFKFVGFYIFEDVLNGYTRFQISTPD